MNLINMPSTLVRVLLLAMITLTGPAQAQDERPVGEVIVELFNGEFGVGGQVRPGSWAGIRLRITDSAAQPRELLIRIAGDDPDGDTPMFESVVASSPGTTRDAWAYIRLPAKLSGPFSVSVYEAIATDDEIRPYRAGDRLGDAQISPRGGGVSDVTSGMYGVLNSRGGLGLNQYAVGPSSNAPHSPLANERTSVVTQLKADMLPDRWMGLDSFDVLVWCDADPLVLGTERPQALIEWIERGGHLVIALPALAQEWTNPRSNPLAQILPRVTIQPVEPEYDFNLLLPLFVGTEGRPTDIEVKDSSLIVRELIADPLARPGEAEEILTDRDGRVLVSRRLVGQGMVTLIGLDLNARPFLRYSMPRAEVFWNRILGRRGAYRSVSELSNQNTKAGELNALARNREPRWYDDDVKDEIATSGRSAAALLLGFIAFGLYWLVAGPLGYGVLKRYGLIRHAWLGYLAAGAVFTLLAWSGALALRPKSVSARHLSVIDHVYGQPLQRSRSWMSLLVPWYGDATVRIDSSDGYHNMIAAWSPRDGGATAIFPDARGYALDARNPNTMRFPTRATVKQLDATWAGAPLDDWSMPTPVLGDGQQGEPKLTIEEDGAKGILRHSLPGELRDVLIVAVSGQYQVGMQQLYLHDGKLLFDARAATQRAWPPGTNLDLSELEGWETLRQTLDTLVPGASNSGVSAMTEADSRHGRLEDRLRALTFFQVLEPPAYVKNNTRGGTLPKRWQSQGLDLSRWLTQPCIIVIGVLEDSPMPMPMTIGSGREFESQGKTLVRWVYPLSGKAPEWSEFLDDEDGPSSVEGG